MPASIPQPIRDRIAEYAPAQADALVAEFNQGEPFWLALAIDKTMADAAGLFTVPTGMRLFLHRLFWEIAVGFTGGSSSAIGVSSDATGFSTKGDLLGGSGGDVTATLGSAGIVGGTLGTKFGSNGIVVIPAGKVIRYDKIVDTYTAGSGFVHVQASILPTS